MGRIPLEDNYDDVINKAQRGLGIADDELARRAVVSVEDLQAIKSGRFNEAVTRRVAGHLRLHRDSVVQLAKKTWYPQQPRFTSGFMAFNTALEDMTVNNYMIWDDRSRYAAVFDTGANCEPVLDILQTERLRLRYIFLTHSHPDHIADLPKLVAATQAEVWCSALDPLDFPGLKRFNENAFFHIGPHSIKTLFTTGHAPGGTTYFISGLSYPLAIVGDSLFASSMGGADHEFYAQAVDNNFKKVLCHPADTVLACGHGPITTVGQERRNNPFFVR
jgi:glyoxylase-like metal-dependent hydrolase (beta-lactamase superfamily II)